MWRVAIYAHEASGRAGARHLDRQIADLAAQIARQPGWCHVVTCVDQGAGQTRPGLTALLADAPDRIDLVCVERYGRLSTDRGELAAILAQLGGAGARVVVMGERPARRLARLVANLALADLVGEALR